MLHFEVNNASKATEVENGGQIWHFPPLPVKFRRAVGKCLREFKHFRLETNFWYIFDGACLGRLDI